MKRQVPLSPEPWAARLPTKAQVFAVKAIADGTANDFQQKAFFRWLLMEVCAVGNMSFRPGSGGDRETAFAEGKRFVGLEVARLQLMTGDQVDKLPKENL